MDLDSYGWSYVWPDSRKLYNKKRVFYHFSKPRTTLRCDVAWEGWEHISPGSDNERWVFEGAGQCKCLHGHPGLWISEHPILFACWCCSVLRESVGHHLCSNNRLPEIIDLENDQLSINEWPTVVCEYLYTKGRTYSFYDRPSFIWAF